MIAAAAREVLSKHGKAGAVEIEVFVPQGEAIALKTLNARLGILGGISILGTTGIVRPMSHEAFTATIEAGLSVARACGLKRVILTTGRRSERFAQACWPGLAQEAYVQIGDFFQAGLARCAAKGFETATLAVFFGKALKMAEGLAHTHAARRQLTLDALARWAAAITADEALAADILAANTAREAFGYLHPDHSEVIAEVGRRIVVAAGQFSGPGLKIQSVIFDYEGRVAFDSERQC
jgi:cobalt-precorrin-5B (C1)-methyltransferase